MVDQDLNGNEMDSNEKYTYYDSTLKNKFFVLVKIYDEGYEDQHNIKLAAEMFINTIKPENVN
jgi:hypothetical protein